MDVTAIKNITTRKRISADVEKLREKVSRENKKLIKIRVAQDTAYWDLKEKLLQVETNHEKLQQNMLEVQMQYETVSGQYQDELRQRAETLNKLASTRQITNVLEDYCERLRDTLSRCNADQTKLSEAYQQSGQMIRELKTQQLQQDEKNRQTIETLNDKLKLTSEYHNQVLQHFNEEKQRAAKELQEEKNKLADVLGKNCELVAANTELGTLVDYSRRELEKKEEIISNLQRDIKQLMQEFTSQANEMKTEMCKMEKQYKETTVVNESLKQALANQETFTKTVCEQSNQLQEKLAAVEEEQTNAGILIKELKDKLQNAEQAKNLFKTEITVLTEKNENLEKAIFDKDEIIASCEIELQKLMDKLNAIDSERSELSKALEKARNEMQVTGSKVQELTEAAKAMETKIQEIEYALKESREKADLQIEQLNNTVAEKNQELELKTSAIAQLMKEVNNISCSRASLEITIQRIRKEFTEEKDVLIKKMEQLEISVRNKDDELSKNLSVILELRSDKERLNGRIQTMQNKIDNVQKELTRPVAARPRIEPEQDDNAVMLTPTANKDNRESEHVFGPPPPRNVAKDDSLLFNFLSDSSMDGENTGDVAAPVNHRYDAIVRGQPFSPFSHSTLNRRRGTDVPASHGGLRFKEPARNEDLSQVKASKQSKPRLFFKNKRHDKKKDFK